jgi:hypothetical protein
MSWREETVRMIRDGHLSTARTIRLVCLLLAFGFVLHAAAHIT